MPKISIIIPIYNVEKYLRECLDSVLAQTLTDLEIILVDDGGKDNCPKIIDEYASKDDRIIAIHKANGGYGHSCNVGLDKASGEYVAIVEPDDFIDKDMYKELYAQAVKDDSDIVKSGYYENYDLGENSYKKFKPDLEEFVVPDRVFTLAEYPQFLRIHPSVWSCIYRREFLSENGIRFKEAAGAGWTDNPFQVQTMCLAKRISYVNKAYYYWRLFSGDDLKDISLPFVRSMEIHEWLKTNNISDEGILSYLYKREYIYLKMVCRIVDLKDLEKYKELLNPYLESLDYDLIEKSTILKKREKKFFEVLKKSPCREVYKAKFKLFRSNIFKFRFKKNEKYLMLFGHYVFDSRK